MLDIRDPPRSMYMIFFPRIICLCINTTSLSHIKHVRLPKSNISFSLPSIQTHSCLLLLSSPLFGLILLPSTTSLGRRTRELTTCSRPSSPASHLQGHRRAASPADPCSAPPIASSPATVLCPPLHTILRALASIQPSCLTWLVCDNPKSKACAAPFNSALSPPRSPGSSTTATCQTRETLTLPRDPFTG